MTPSHVINPLLADYPSFVSRMHGMITFEMMRELDKLNLTMMFQDAGIQVSLAEIRAKEEKQLNVPGRQVRVTFDRFMETTFLVPDNNISSSNEPLYQLVRPIAQSLAEAVEKDVKALRPLPFFSAEPPVLWDDACLASKTTKIFGELWVRTELGPMPDGKLSMAATILYGSAA